MTRLNASGHTIHQEKRCDRGTKNKEHLKKEAQPIKSDRVTEKHSRITRAPDQQAQEKNNQKTARSDPGTRVMETEMLCCPHLVLADFGNDDGFVFHQITQCSDDELWVQ